MAGTGSMLPPGRYLATTCPGALRCRRRADRAGSTAATAAKPGAHVGRAGARRRRSGYGPVGSLCGGILATRIGVQDQRRPTVRAAFVTELGPPENIQVGELPTPEVSAFDVLVQTRAL